MTGKQPTIVAELGRPERPEEAAARRAESSRRRRANQTLFNLVLALLATLAIVLFLVLVVVRPAPAPVDRVDYPTIAAEAQGGASEPLVVPVLPETWSANAAHLDTVSEVPTWYIGFVTPATQFIALNQGIGANPTWLAAVLDDADATGSTTIEGVNWTVYDNRSAEDPGNFAYALSTTVGGSMIALHGTAPTDEFELLATAIAAGIAAP